MLFALTILSYLAVFTFTYSHIPVSYTHLEMKGFGEKGGLNKEQKATFLAKAFHLPISVAESHAAGFRVRFVAILHQCTPHGFFFGDRCV